MSRSGGTVRPLWKTWWVVATSILVLVFALVVAAGVVSGYGAKLVNFDLSALAGRVAPEFRQATLTEPATGTTLAYNLFVPSDYDPAKAYPLVLFMHDSSVSGGGPTATLTQGYGALVWATPEAQAKQEVLVLAPQYATVITDDSHQLNAEGEATVPLIKQVMADYSVDPERVYATGQSMGAMAAFALNLEYPDLFAASWYVAGQWETDEMAPLADTKMIYTVSAGDLKASPGMDAFADLLSENGVVTARALWDGRWPQAENDLAAGYLFSQGRDVNLVKFAASTVTPPGALVGQGALEHIYTWDVAYKLTAIRDWLLAQRRQ